MSTFTERAKTFVSGHDPEVARLADSLQSAVNNNELLRENMAQLEMAIRGDEGWRRLATDLEHEFTREGLDEIMRISRAMYLSSPLIQRAVNVRTYYVWAQGYEFRAKDERVQKEVVEIQIQKESNRREIYSHQARVLTDVDQNVDGSVFLALFTDPVGDIEVRTVPTEQIREIIPDPQDRNQIRFYRRRWSQKEFDMNTGNYRVTEHEALYPDIHFHPTVKRESIGSTPVFWDAPIIHQRIGGLKQMLFGVPTTYAALEWARANKKYLEDWHTVVASLARFAWKASVKGSKAQRLKERLRRRGTELAEPEEPGSETGAPIAGSMWADQADLTPISKTGAATSAGDAKQSRLMVGAAMDLPDTILSGDPQQGNLATATTLDRPTELAMRHIQSLWNDFDGEIWRYVVDAKVRRGRLPGRIIRTPDGTVVDPGIDATVNTVFPPILEHDPEKMVRAITTAATLAGKTDSFTIPRNELSKLLMAALHVQDIEQAIKDLAQPEQDELRKAVDKLRDEAAPDVPVAAGEGRNGGPPEEEDDDEE